MSTAVGAQVRPDLSPAHALLSAARQRPDHLSLVDAHREISLTLQQSATFVRALAWEFTRLGVEAGDRIVVCAPNSIWHFLIHAAASWIHAVTVPLSPLLPVSQREHQLAQVCPTILIHEDLVQPLKSVETTVLSFDDLERFVQDACNNCPEDFLPLPCHDETAALVFTSGTSGKMRAAALSHANLWWASQCFRDGFQYSPGSAICGVVAPLSHIGGFNGTSMDIFTHGGTVVVFSAFHPDTLAREIQKWRISIMFAVPAMCYPLLRTAFDRGFDLSSWTHPLIGGDAMGACLFDEMKAMGLSPIHVWGMTELGGAGTFLSPDCWHAHPGAIGFPFPYVERRLVSSEGHVIDEAGHAGMIEVRGPGVASHYWGEEARENEWFSTSDIAVYDADRCLHMLGRSSRVINTGGELVAPALVEEALRSLDCVADCCVIGLEDPQWGQVVAAALVPTSHSTPSAEELRTLLGDSLAPWQRPRRILWIDELPQTTTGKTDFTHLSSIFK